jgi:RNA polymerase sigma factor (TIGR02999 family)
MARVRVILLTESRPRPIVCGAGQGRFPLPSAMTSSNPERPSTALPDRTTTGREALDRLLPEVYAELRRIARRELARDRSGHTLETAALVHEAYLRLARPGNVQWRNRPHFFAIAARAMRTVLIDYARARRALKRGGGVPPGPGADALPGLADEEVDRLLAIDEALERLDAVDPEACRVVESRYFAGLTLDECATAHDVSISTVRRRWSAAKAWLRQELGEAN